MFLAPISALIKDWLYINFDNYNNVFESELKKFHYSASSKIFQDWRKNVFGAIDDPRIRFLNTIEYAWYDDLMYRKDWVACDQIVMAVYLDESIVTSRQNYWVIRITRLLT